MKKKIVFFTESMELMGGMERVIAFLANQFQDKYEVIILTMYGTTSPYFDVDSAIESLNIHVLPINSLSKLKRYFLTWYRLRSYLKKHLEIDYFIANTPALCCSTMLASLSLIDYRMKVIAFEHHKYSFPSKFWQVIRKYTYKYCHRVIALTSDAHQFYLSIGCPSVYIPNALTLESRGVSTLTSKTLVSIGRLTASKGFSKLLDAWKLVSIKCPSWQLEIVGDGEEKINLKKQAAYLGILDNVQFYGEVKCVQERYMAASGFVLSSDHEGFGLVLVEAMSHGLPCISFDCDSGPRDIIIEKVNGFLVTPNNVEELAEAMMKYIRLSDDEKNIMSQKAKETSGRFLSSNIMDKWYKEVLND